MEENRVKDIKIEGPMTVDELMCQMSESGGFTGRKLADATDIIEKMVKDEKCVTFLSFPACIMATGTRGVLVELVKRKLVDVIITTCGTLDHDLARTWKHYYKGDFLMDDAELRRRASTVWATCWSRTRATAWCWRRSSSPCSRRSWRAGTRSPRTSSSTRLASAWTTRNRCSIGPTGTTSRSSCRVSPTVPSVPRPGCTGRRTAISRSTCSRTSRSSPTSYSTRTIPGLSSSGGGISKHHVIWWNQFKGGLDYAVYLTTASEYDGSLSGAQVREAVSWGKVKETAAQITVEGDATIALPHRRQHHRANAISKTWW